MNYMCTAEITAISRYEAILKLNINLLVLTSHQFYSANCGVYNR